MSSSRFLCLVSAALIAMVPSPLQAGEHWVDPVNGSPSGDGTAGDPWLTLEQVFADDLIETRHWESLPYEPGLELEVVNDGAPVQPGDTIWLRSGYHGEISVYGAYNEAPITIAAAPGQTPRLSRVLLGAAQHWVLRGLTISRSFLPGPLTAGNLVHIDDHDHHGPSWDILLEDNILYSVADASGWGADEWIDLASSGIRVDSDRVQVIGNRLRNVRFGISVGGEDARVRFNEIDGFSADGLRGLGDGGWYEYNIVKNAYVDGPTDPNHDDGFQSWSVGPGGVGTGEVRDVVLRGNIFINHENPDHPLFSTLQGIGCFDGLFVDWIVENNVVVVDHWHGISLYGMIGGRIVNNTVLDIDDDQPGPPWIKTADHGATPSQDVVVRNNLATDYELDGTNIQSDHNVTLADPDSLFVAAPFDVHLRPDATAAIDTGSPDLAPSRDADRVSRPRGPAIDLGAYELCSGCIFFDGFETGDTGAW